LHAVISVLPFRRVHDVKTKRYTNVPRAIENLASTKVRYKPRISNLFRLGDCRIGLNRVGGDDLLRKNFVDSAPG